MAETKKRQQSTLLSLHIMLGFTRTNKIRRQNYIIPKDGNGRRWSRDPREPLSPSDLTRPVKPLNHVSTPYTRGRSPLESRSSPRPSTQVSETSSDIFSHRTPDPFTLYERFSREGWHSRSSTNIPKPQFRKNPNSTQIPPKGFGSKRYHSSLWVRSFTKFYLEIPLHTRTHYRRHY